MSIKERVKNALIKVPALRDDLNLTAALLWKTDLKQLGHDIESEPITAMLTEISLGKLTNFRSIQRWWCKVQEDCPELRGTKYLERHNVDEPNVRQEIKTTNIQEI